MTREDSLTAMIRLVPTVGYDRLIGKKKCRSLYDPLMDDAPALAHTLAVSVKQRIAFGERAGQQVRRIGSGFGYEGERPALTGPRCANVHGFSLTPTLRCQHIDGTSWNA